MAAEKISATDILKGKTRSHRTRALEAPQHGGGKIQLTQKNYVGNKLPGKLTLAEGVRRQIKHVPAEGQKPAYDHVKHMNIDIHLREGVKPDPQTGEISGLIEIKVRKIEPRDGSGKINYYLYMNVFPLGEDDQVEHAITLAQFVRDESAFETVYTPHTDQKIQQASIFVGPLPTSETGAAASTT
jgi:hypothetical protein